MLLYSAMKLNFRFLFTRLPITKLFLKHVPIAKIFILNNITTIHFLMKMMLEAIADALL